LQVDPNDYLARIDVAFKTLQILGQIVKNFPGSLDGRQKLQLVEECYGIGLRTLRSVFGYMEQTTDAFVDSIVKSLREETAELSKAELQDRVRKSLFGLAHLLTHGIVKRISSAVGSPHLGQVYDLIRKNHDSPSFNLVHASLSLDQQWAFPTEEIERLNEELEGNLLAHFTLRSLVVVHFHLFAVKFDLKQRICDRLGISFKRLQLQNPRERLLGP
jgi:hypothetical protein